MSETKKLVEAKKVVTPKLLAAKLRTIYEIAYSTFTEGTKENDTQFFLRDGVIGLFLGIGTIENPSTLFSN